jgi:hypothetical protein
VADTSSPPAFSPWFLFRRAPCRGPASRVAARGRNRMRQWGRGDGRRRHLRQQAALCRHGRRRRSDVGSSGCPPCSKPTCGPAVIASRSFRHSHRLGWRRAQPGFTSLPDLLGETGFGEGFAALSRLPLSYDAWLYHPRIGELTELAGRSRSAKSCLIMSVARSASGPLQASTLTSSPVARAAMGALASSRTCQARRPRHAHRWLQLLRGARAAVLRGARHGVACLFRNVHRGVRSITRDVLRATSPSAKDPTATQYTACKLSLRGPAQRGGPIRRTAARFCC